MLDNRDPSTKGGGTITASLCYTVERRLMMATFLGSYAS